MGNFYECIQSIQNKINLLESIIISRHCCDRMSSPNQGLKSIPVQCSKMGFGDKSLSP